MTEIVVHLVASRPFCDLVLRGFHNKRSLASVERGRERGRKIGRERGRGRERERERERE